MNFDNKISSQDVHYSRYIASFIKECGRLGVRFNYGLFAKWLMRQNLSEDEVKAIWMMAFNGRLELEDDARAFLTEMIKQSES